MKVKKINETILVIDDLLPLNIIKNFNLTLGQNLEWVVKLEETTSKYNNNDLKNVSNVYEQFQFVHNERRTEISNEINTESTHFIYFPLMTWILNSGYSLEYHQIQRCKVNLQTRALEDTKGKFNHPHTDVKIDDGVKDKYTAIYYVNDSDGDTYFFNENQTFANDLNNLDKLTLMGRVSPKAGRLVVFPPNIVHAGAHPIDSDYRLVINYNFWLAPLRKNHIDRMKKMNLL